MLSRTLLFAGAVLACTLWQSVCTSTSGQGQPPAALTGVVTSAEEGAMEGVVVSAKKQGSIATISVVSDAQGRFSFPEPRLEAGSYAISIRAIGYELDGPGTANVAAEKTTVLDLKLRKTRKLASQLSNAEWITSMPG